MALKQTLLPSFALLAVVSLLTGCTQARPADVPGKSSANATSSAPIPATPTPTAAAASVGYVATATARVISWPDANATLTPLLAPSTSLVSAASAFTAISTGFNSVMTTAAPSGQATAALYSYSNSAYGQIRADGTVKLAYTEAPVWAFLIPLSKYLDLSQGALGSKPSQVVRTHCTFYYLVDATTGDFLTSGQECKTRGPTSLENPPAN